MTHTKHIKVNSECTSKDAFPTLTEDEILNKLAQSRKHASNGLYEDAYKVINELRKKYTL